MKKILFIVFLAISATSFGQGNWTLSGAKNRWANGVGFGNKDTSTYTNASDTNLLVLQYPGVLCYRHLTTDFWQILGMYTSVGFVLKDLSNVNTNASLLIPSGNVTASAMTVTGIIRAGGITTTGAITSNGALTIKASEGDGVWDTSGVIYANGMEIGHTAARGANIYPSIIYNQAQTGYGLRVNAGATRGRPGFFLSDYTNTDSVINASPAGVWFYKPVNISSTISTGGLTVTNNETVGGNLTVTGSISAANFPSILGSYLPLAGGTMTGSINMGGNNVTNAGNVAGTLTTASQPNITLVGTLTALTVSGIISASGVTSIGTISTLGLIANTGSTGISAVSGIAATGNGGNFSNNSSTNEALAVANFGNGYLTKWTNVGGTVATVTNSGTITTTGNIQAASITATAGVNGTITTAAQPNITSLGTLVNLTVSGNAKINTLNNDASTMISSGLVQSNLGFVAGIGGGGAMTALLSQYQSNANSRSWRLRQDQSAFGDFHIQQSTTQTGNTFASVLAFDPSKNATFYGNIIKDGGTSSQALMANGSVQTLTSGTYTPTVTNLANTSSLSSDICYYQRIGNVVTVGFAVYGTATASSSCQLTITLPVGASFSAANQAWGSASAQHTLGTSTNVGATVTANNGAANVLFTFYAPASFTTFGFYGTFTYQVQ